MLNIELMLENGEPSKKHPLLLKDEKVSMFFGDIKDEIPELVTYEDLCDFKDKFRMLNMAYNALWCRFVNNTNGEPYNGRIAVVAYDEFGDFPVWVAVGDNRYGNKLKCGFYDAVQKNDRREFAWAIRKNK